MRGIWAVTLLLSGCSLFDSLDVEYVSGTEDSGDVGTHADLSLDSEIAVDMAVDDLSLDVEADAPIDMQADIAEDLGGACLSELPRTGLPTGITCEIIPVETGFSSCDVVEQTGCPLGNYCDLLPTNQSTVVTVCRNGLSVTTSTCDFVAYGDACAQRATVDGEVESQGACYPGSICRGIKPGELTSPCAKYCELESAKGCDAAEYCVPISAPYNVFGIGRCATDSTDCPDQ